MSVEQPSHQSAPLLKGSEEQVVKLRKRLEDVFRNVSLAHDVVAICIELSEGNSWDFNPEVAHVLRRCAADRLHFQMGELAIETDEGYRVASRDAQKALLTDWHLEPSAGQYRGPRDGRVTARRVKLVHNIVFSMPSPTPAEKVLAAGRKFAREKFALQHRFAIALHKHSEPWSPLGPRRPINLTLKAKPCSPVKSDPSLNVCRRC